MGKIHTIEKNGIYIAMPWVIFLCFMQVFSDKMFGIITPIIATSFQIDTSTVSLISTVAMLVFGIAGAVYSTLSDVISPRKLFVVGALAFSVGSIMGFIFNFSFPLVIISRAIQVAGAAVIPGCFIVLVRKYVDEDRQATYLGFNTAMYQLSAGLGSLLGGYVTKYLSWNITFVIPAVVLITIPVFLKYLPNDDNKDMKSNLDILGILLITIIFGTMLFSISNKNLLYAGISIVSMAIYAAYALKVKNPIIDLRLFKTPKLLSGTLVSCVIYSVQMVFFFIFSFMILNSYNIDIAYVGLMYVPANFSAFLSGMLSGLITKKIGSTKAFYIGCCVIAISLFMFAFFLGQNIIIMWLALALFGIGYTIIYPGYYSAFSNALPKEIVGRAMAVNNLINRICYAIMIALAGAAMASDLLKIKFLPGSILSADGSVYSNICLILGIFAIIAMISYSIVFKQSTTTTKGE